MLKTSLFDYELPEELIAQEGAARRDESRLLVVHRKERRIEHRRFSELGEFLEKGDCLFLNRASVLPARLRGRRSGGGAVECFLLAEEAPVFGASGGVAEVWRCLLRPGKKLPAGAEFAGAGFAGRVLEKLDEGVARVGFVVMEAGGVRGLANRVGEVPLPPYIRRADGMERRAEDLERYETVFADKGRQVAVAAPTAGLHFTEELLASLEAKGVGSAGVTLHVGLGTFKPMTTELVGEHKIHREVVEVPVLAQKALFKTKGRRVAVGTTSVRAVESFLEGHGKALKEDWVTETELFVFPPREFRGVDVMITNFHQPRSTLMCLVAAFLCPGSVEGVEWLKEIYGEAVREKYRFLSYGDAMLIL